MLQSPAPWQPATHPDPHVIARGQKCYQQCAKTTSNQFTSQQARFFSSGAQTQKHTYCRILDTKQIHFSQTLQTRKRGTLNRCSQHTQVLLKGRRHYQQPLCSNSQDNQTNKTSQVHNMMLHGIIILLKQSSQFPAPVQTKPLKTVQYQDYGGRE
jgi:hypothetical protein